MNHGSGNPPPPPGSQPEWPQELLDRIHRVFQYHQDSKETYDSVRSQRGADPRTRPAMFRTFDSAEKIPLPTNLIAADAPTVSLLLDGRGAVPESQLDPPHNLRTLASWLFYADGVLGKRTEHSRVTWLRTLVSSGDTFPCELYVAAFAVDG